MYIWGVLHLLFFDDWHQAEACNAAVGAGHLTGYAPSFIPLRFGCLTDDGRTVEVAIPPYVNPAAALLGACAVAVTALKIAVTRRPTRDDAHAARTGVVGRL